MPDGCDGVDDVPGVEVAGSGGDGLAGGALRVAGQGPRLTLDRGTSRTVDGPRYPTTGEQVGIGGVDDGIGLDAGDVSLKEGEGVTVDGDVQGGPPGNGICPPKGCDAEYWIRAGGPNLS